MISVTAPVKDRRILKVDPATVVRRSAETVFEEVHEERCGRSPNPLLKRDRCVLKSDLATEDRGTGEVVSGWRLRSVKG